MIKTILIILISFGFCSGQYSNDLVTSTVVQGTWDSRSVSGDTLTFIEGAGTQGNGYTSDDSPLVSGRQYTITVACSILAGLNHIAGVFTGGSAGYVSGASQLSLSNGLNEQTFTYNGSGENAVIRLLETGTDACTLKVWLYTIIEKSPGLYIDPTGGSDTNFGNSVTQALETYSEAMGNTTHTLGYFYQRTGTEARETVTVAGSGVADSIITITCYDSATGLTGAAALALGDTAVIMGSTSHTTGWSDNGSNVWYKDGIANDPYVAWLDGVSYWKADNASVIDVNYRWYYITDTLFIYATSDPDGFYNSIEVPTESYAGRISNKNYIIVDNLHFKYSRSCTFQIRGTSSYNTIQNCIIEGSGKNSSLALSDEANNNIIDNCTIIGDNRAHSGDTFHSWNEGGDHPDSNTLKNCIISNGSHSTVSIVNVSDWLIENNEIYSSYGFGRAVELMGVSGQGNNIFRYNYVHHSGGQTPEVLPYYSDGSNQFNGDNNQVYYNIFYSGTGNLISLSTWNDGTHGQLICRDSEIYNNIVFGTTDNRVGIAFNIANAADTGNVIKNNIFVENDDVNYLQVKILGESYINNITFQNNLIYSSNTTSTVHDSIAARTVAYMNTNYSSWSGNLAVDPILPDYTSQSIYTHVINNELHMTQENWRVIISNSEISANGDQVRIQFKASSDDMMYIDGLSIGQRSGATDDFIRTPTRVTFDDGNNSTTLVQGTTKWSDWINFNLESGKDHLVHLYHDYGSNGTSKTKRSTSQNGSYYLDSATDYTDSLNITSDDTYYYCIVLAIEGRTLSSFIPTKNSPCIDAGTDVGLVLDYAGNTVPALVNKKLVDIGAYEYFLSFGYKMQLRIHKNLQDFRSWSN